jgi:hypothetical protein
MTDLPPAQNSQFSTLNSQFSVIGRFAHLGDGREFPLDSLADFGFLVLEPDGFAIARVFRAPDGTRLLADAHAFAGTPETAFERLWHGHFKRNFLIVGMTEDDAHATARIRDAVFAACLERSIRLAAHAANGRILQIGHFEETPDGLRRILPRGAAPTVPPLVVQPVTVEAEWTNPDIFGSHVFVHEGLATDEPASCRRAVAGALSLARTTPTAPAPLP